MIKKNTTFLALIIAAMVGLQACSNNDKKSAETADTTLQDTNKLVISSLLHQSVDYNLAMECVNSYAANYQERNGKITNHISFEKDSLQKWLKNLDEVTEYTSIRVTLGYYTPKILETYKKDPKLAGRLTAFLFPFNGDKNAVYKPKGDSVAIDTPIVVPPFNLGDIHPPK